MDGGWVGVTQVRIWVGSVGWAVKDVHSSFQEEVKAQRFPVPTFPSSIRHTVHCDNFSCARVTSFYQSPSSQTLFCGADCVTETLLPSAWLKATL